MGKMLKVIVFGVLMFAVSAGGSWYVMKTLTPQQAVATDAATGDVAAKAAAAANPQKGDELSSRMPVAVRPSDMSVEELLRFSMGVKEREERVKQSEELLQKRSMQQQLALQDVAAERKEIDGLRLQVSNQLKNAETLIDRLNAVRDEFMLEKEKESESLQQMKHERVTIQQDHLDNTKRLSSWIQNMQAEKAAEVLSAMANDSPDQMEIAVQILRNLEEREAAKILSSIEDTKLVQQLIERFRHLQKPPTKSAKAR